MSQLNNFSLLGYDLRDGQPPLWTVDACLWGQSKEYFEIIDQRAGSENMIQLLECPPEVVERAVKPGVFALAIFTDANGLAALGHLTGEPILALSETANILLDRGWLYEGLDIADANGYFSLYDIDSLNRKLMPEIKQVWSTEDAESLVKSADMVYPSHAPFAVFAVLAFKHKAASVVELEG